LFGEKKSYVDIKKDEKLKDTGILANKYIK
jgi:hypothetical protein